MAKGAVEIALAGRDKFRTAVTSALIRFPRRAPLRHRFVPHCLCLPALFAWAGAAVRSPTDRDDIYIKIGKRNTRFLYC